MIALCIDKVILLIVVESLIYPKTKDVMKKF